MKPAKRRSGMSRTERLTLDALHREAVMRRHGASLFTDEGKNQWYGNCLKCGRDRWLQVSHIEPKGRFPHMRWDPQNAVALCAGCHLFWWHKSPREAEEWISEVLGGLRETLAVRARSGGGKQDYTLLRLSLLHDIAKAG